MQKPLLQSKQFDETEMDINVVSTNGQHNANRFLLQVWFKTTRDTRVQKSQLQNKQFDDEPELKIIVVTHMADTMPTDSCYKYDLALFGC